MTAVAFSKIESNLYQRCQKLLKDLGVTCPENGSIISHTPITGEVIGTVNAASKEEMENAIDLAHQAFLAWRSVPAPKRGELIRLFGEELRNHKETLGELVTLEAGKIRQEGLGEVQEMIDICDFSVGLSRQLYGLTIASERPGHRMMETWHPLGVVGLITPFNFPVAVWVWNFALAIVCGNSTVWKPSEKTPLTAMACQKLFEKALAKFGEAPLALSVLVQGFQDVAEILVNSRKVPLISATGSTAMGRSVGQKVAARFGKTILELGGNNSMIVTPSANLDLALRAIVFSAVGTAGQRCTSLRRLFVHHSIKDQLVAKLKAVYATLTVGNSLSPDTLCGPLIDRNSYEQMQNRLLEASNQGGIVFGGNRILEMDYPNAFYVTPALVEMPTQTEVMHTETFAPILYVTSYSDLENAIAMNNAVPQGLSSAIFTLDICEAELFVSAVGSDCGIANINIGPSGAEIGGAFGGDKESGGGRESGSDSWRNYMRRATNTINFSKELPLAQGIKFDF